MVIVVMKGLRLALIRYPLLRFGKVHKWVTPHCLVLDLMILRNLVFRLRNVQIWVVLSGKLVVLLIFTNYLFKLQTFSYGLCRTEDSLFADCQEWHFQDMIRSDNCSILPERGSMFPEIQE